MVYLPVSLVQAVPSVLSRRVAEYHASDFWELLRMRRHVA